MLKKALIDRDTNIVIGVMEVSEQGFAALSARSNQLYWDCTRYDVNPGDIFKDGVFYSADNPDQQVEYIPSNEEKIADLEARLNALLGVEGV